MIKTMSNDKTMSYEEFELALKKAGVIDVEMAGGRCPFQVEAATKPVGDCKEPFMYFRARGTGWHFELFPDRESCDNYVGEIVHEEGDWGDNPFAAGYMDYDDALPIILDQLSRIDFAAIA